MRFGAARTTLHRAGSISLLAAVICVFAACAGTPQSTADPLLLPALPPALRVPTIVWTPGDTHHDFAGELPTAVNDVWGRIIAAGYEPFDPTVANTSGAAHDFAHYVTFQQVDGRAFTHHVVFITAVPWTVDRADRFLQAFYPMPARTPIEAGVPYFHFYGVEDPPFALAYVFGNAWWGWLESALLSSFAELDAEPEHVANWLVASQRRLAELGVVIDGTDDIARMDALLAQLPRDEVSTFHPIGTLAAIGLLLGEELRRRDDRLRWVAGGDAMGTLFALTVDGAEDTYLRPVDFVVQAYHANIPDPLAAYLGLAERRLNDVPRE